MMKEPYKYKDYYLVYLRRSTDDPDSQKNSLHFQKSESIKFADKNGIKIAPVSINNFCSSGIISEKHSGFKEDSDFTILKDGVVQYKIDRPKFYQLVGYLSKGYFKGIICLCWDRVSRNKADDVLVNKLMKQGVNILFTHSHYDDSSAGALHMDIDGAFAAHHSRVTSEKIRLATTQSRALGKVTYRAPIGYLNEGNQDHKPFDPVRAPLVKKLFELYATGKYTLSDLTKFALEAGLTSVPVRRPRTEDEMLADEDIDIPKTSRFLTSTHLSYILRRPFYIGLIMGNEGQYIRSTSHEPLISEELFNKVQKMLKNKKVSTYYSNKLDLPYRDLIYCTCGRVYTPYMQKGKQYFTPKCKPECTNTKKSFNIDTLEDTLGGIMEQLVFTEAEIEEIFSRTSEDIAALDNKRQIEIERMERQKKKLREDLTYLGENKLALLRIGTYTPEQILAEESRLTSALAEFRSREETSDISMSETIKEVVKLSELLKSVNLYYKMANSSKKEEIIRQVMSELTFSENTLNYQCKPPFKALQNRFLSDCAPKLWLSELSQPFDTRILRSIITSI